MKQTLVFLLSALFPLSGWAMDHKAMYRLWQKPVAPLSGAPAAIGSYSAGCLWGAARLPMDGEGYSVMRPSRLRYFGHPDLIRYLESLGKEAQKAGLPRLLVGDLGRPRGGPMISGHASHQIGLDVDIWYRFSNKRPSVQQRETWSAESYVSSEGKVTAGWGDKERHLVELAATTDGVERVFVHAAIKRDLCQKFPGAPWLAKLRPWWGHDDHLHVRLKCPQGNSLCQEQERVTASAEQCGSELEWWFSQEAKDELAKKKEAHGREFPKLPTQCEKLVAEFKGKK